MSEQPHRDDQLRAEGWTVQVVEPCFAILRREDVVVLEHRVYGDRHGVYEVGKRHEFTLKEWVKLQVALCLPAWPNAEASEDQEGALLTNLGRSFRGPRREGA